AGCHTMQRLAGKCRGSLVSCLLASFVVSGLVATVLMTTPPAARAQQDDEKPAEPPVDQKAKTGPVNPIVHFFQSIGILFGLIFAAISVGMVALVILLLLDLRLGEAVPTAFVDEFTNMVNKRQFKQAYDLCKSDSSF